MASFRASSQADGSVVVEILADDSKFQKTTSSIGATAGAVLKGMTTAVVAASAAAGTAIAAIGKSAVAAFADYEQLVGGVETLFKDSAPMVEAYAANAYKTAGLSANAYMETVTSFSASLLQSLGGDTEAAANVADMAITDMADNANKMGTSMEAIQDAYQGFAKQNYTMLDNLKLGYGGTKTEMERLLADATALSGIEYDISNLNDVYEAIHVVQTELGVTGTTAKEASVTIQGSIASTKAAWSNMLVGLADDTQDLDILLENLIDSAGNVVENLIPRIETVLGSIAQMAAKVVPKIAAELPGLIAELLPTLVTLGVSVVESLANGIADSAGTLGGIAVDVMSSLTKGILATLPRLAVTAVQMLAALVQGIGAALPTIIPAAVEAVATLAQGLIDCIPELISGALQLVQGLVQGLIEAIPVLLEAAPIIISNLATALLECIPEIIQAGIDLLTSLITALPEIITQIGTAIPQIISDISRLLQESIPQIVEAGIMLLTALIDGLPEIIQTIVAALPQIITSIIGALTDNIPLIVQAGVGLFVSLIQNLPQIIVEIVKAVPEIVSAIVAGFASLADSIVNIGVNIVSGVWDGICSMGNWIKDKVTGFFDGIVGGVKDFLGIHSPSKVFAGIGANSIEGFADGVDDGAGANESRVMSTVAGLSADMADGLGAGGANSGEALMRQLTDSASSGIQGIAAVANNAAKTFCNAISSKRGEFQSVGIAAMSGLNEGLRIQGQQAILTARNIANSIVAEMQRALDIHSPSRRIRDLVGKPAAQGFFVGFEDEMTRFHRLAQDTIDRETGKISISAAADADGKTAAQGITREVHTNNKTVEKIATVEGDGVTGELVRMLGLKIKAEDRRRGEGLDE